MLRTILFLLLTAASVAGRDVLAASPSLPRLLVQSSLKANRRRTSTTTTTLTAPAASIDQVTNIRATTAAKAPVKTMTSRQMGAFKLLSGGVAGTISSVLTNPLEVLKTQLQSSGTSTMGRDPWGMAKKIMEQDGVSGFFRGLPPTLVGIIPARSVYFYSYTKCKSALGPYFTEGSPANALFSGFLAGIASNTLTNPIWMVRTRMQLLPTVGQKAYAGYGDAMATIWREEGIGGFYKGIQASYWGCTEGAIQFIIYEQLKTRLLKRENARRERAGLGQTQQLSKVTYFCSAAVAKCLAAVGTYPHEVARTRLREQATGGVFKYTGMWQTIGLIGREEGKAGLYSGMGVHLVKVVPNSAIMFLTYEIVNLWLEKFKVVDN